MLFMQNGLFQHPVKPCASTEEQEQLLFLQRVCALLSGSARGCPRAQSSASGAPAAGTPAQTGSPAPQMGGVNTGGTHAAVLDSEHRPITAGGFVASGPVVFEDATKAAGLSGWQHVMGTRTKKYILETDGSGVGLIDYDNDGWLDIYLVNGSTYDALAGKRRAACRAVPQQSRWDVYRCGREGRSDERSLGIRRGDCGL